MKRLVFAWTCMLVAAAASAEDLVVSRAIQGGFADVRDRVVLAVELQGLVVDHVSKVSEMLARTGKDVGASREVYAQGEVLEFCSAVVSRQMMEADPRLLTFCPFGIAVYTLPADPGKTYVAFRRPSAAATGAQKQALQRVEALLQAILDEASE
jgi:uncharacterized protein (DUF302 family)